VVTVQLCLPPEEGDERLTLSRGASGSAGHTSWSARPELGDYASLYGFMIHYLHGLMTGKSWRPQNAKDQLSTVSSAAEADASHVQPRSHRRIVLAGYSYGSMIASHLPGVDRIMELFENAAESSAECEIQLRAVHLSSQTINSIETRQERVHGRKSLKVPASHSNLGSEHSSSSVLVGGFESEAAEKRIGRESRRSLDVRKSLDRVREKMHSRGHRLPAGNDESDGDDAQANTRCNVTVPQVCYLLISPVLPPVAVLATAFSTLSFQGRDKEKYIASNDAGGELAKHPSLAVYGSRDFFTSVKKLRTWAQRLTQQSGSNFRQCEVNGAGHFWHETGVLEQMKECIREWESSL
jgi:pimeloyl-ACP methyl ester carboxylesterase